MSLHHDLILDHYKNPRNFGELSDADVTIKEENIECGDDIEIFLKLQGRNAKRQIEKIKWRGRGCAIAMAGASMLSERALRMKDEGQRMKEENSIRRILALTDKDMVKMLGGEISPSRMKCATLALRAMQKVLASL